MFPKEEKFELVIQINRASSSISAKLAQSSGRASNKDQAHFTDMSYLKGLKTINHLSTALDMEIINIEKYTELRIQLNSFWNKLNSLYKYQINNKETLKKRV